MVRKIYGRKKEGIKNVGGIVGLRWFGEEMGMEVEVAEWSKALDSGSSPKWHGFKSRPLHFFIPSSPALPALSSLIYSVKLLNNNKKISDKV